MAAILWKFELFDVALIWHQIRNLRPELVELDYFEHSLFIFDTYLLLAKISQKFGKYVRLTVCLSVCLSVCLFVCLSATQYSSQFLTN